MEKKLSKLKLSFSIYATVIHFSTETLIRNINKILFFRFFQMAIVAFLFSVLNAGAFANVNTQNIDHKLESKIIKSGIHAQKLTIKSTLKDNTSVAVENLESAAKENTGDQAMPVGAAKKNESKVILKPEDKFWVQLKTYEQEKKWAQCIAASESKSKKMNFDLELSGWPALIWVRCLNNAELDKKNFENIQNFIKWFEKNEKDFKNQNSAVWKDLFATELVKLKLNWSEFIKTINSDFSFQQSVWIIEKSGTNDKDILSRSYALLGDLLATQGQNLPSEYYYQQSLQFKDSKIVKEKLKGLQKLISFNKKENSINSSDELTKSDLNKTELNKFEPVSEVEKEYDEKFKNLVKNQDHLGMVKDCINYLEKYPGGKKSKWAQEKILEIYFAAVDAATDRTPLEKITDKSSYEKLLNEKPEIEYLNKVRQSLLKADTMRKVDWARTFHKRNDFKGSLVLAEKVLEDNPVGAFSGILLYIAGRSAQFAGDYAKASKYFEMYIDKFSSGDEFNEVLFRLALVNFRQQNYSLSVANLEKLLSQKKSEKYELSAKYWIVRGLQMSTSVKLSNLELTNAVQSRIDEEIKYIVGKFPISYYAFKLNAEKNNGELKWPLPENLEKNIEGEIYLLPQQKAQWNRIKKLTEIEWYAEAQDEINAFVSPANQKLKFLLSQNWLSSKAYPMVIKTFNDVIDTLPEIKNLSLVKTVYPVEYQKEISEQSGKQKLNPILVRSLIRQESAFGNKATSTSNAYGLMQMIGPTAQEVAEELKINGLEIPMDLYQPNINIRMGTYYIAKVIRQMGGHVPLGLAAYNAGPHKVLSFLKLRPDLLSIPKTNSDDFKEEIWYDELPWSETSFYVKAILRNVIIYKFIESNNTKTKWDQVLWSDLVLAADRNSG